MRRKWMAAAPALILMGPAGAPFVESPESGRARCVGFCVKDHPGNPLCEMKSAMPVSSHNSVSDAQLPVCRPSARYAQTRAQFSVCALHDQLQGKRPELVTLRELTGSPRTSSSGMPAMAAEAFPSKLGPPRFKLAPIAKRFVSFPKSECSHGGIPMRQLRGWLGADRADPPPPSFFRDLHALVSGFKKQGAVVVHTQAR